MLDHLFLANDVAGAWAKSAGPRLPGISRVQTMLDRAKAYAPSFRKYLGMGPLEGLNTLAKNPNMTRRQVLSDAGRAGQNIGMQAVAPPLLAAARRMQPPPVPGVGGSAPLINAVLHPSEASARALVSGLAPGLTGLPAAQRAASGSLSAAQAAAAQPMSRRRFLGHMLRGLGDPTMRRGTSAAVSSAVKAVPSAAKSLGTILL